MSRKTKQPQPQIDPRLQRVFDVLDETWDGSDGNVRNWDAFARLVLEATAFRNLVSNDLVKQAIRLIVTANHRNNDLEFTLDELAKIADDEHRAHCACCQRKHGKEAA
jgi:hypothetical protein